MLSDRFRNLLNPGIYILNRFKYATKFGLMIVLFLISVVIASVSIYLQTTAQIEFSKKERIGLEYIVGLNKLLFYAQQHDALMGPSFDNIELAKEFALAEEKMTEAERHVDELDRKYGDILRVSQMWKELREKRKHPRIRPALDDIPIAPHVAYLRGILDLKQKIAETSNLVLDNGLTSHYLMNALVNNIPSLTQHVSDIRTVAASFNLGLKSHLISDKIRILDAFLQDDVRNLERDMNVIGVGDSHYLAISVSQQREILRNFSAHIRGIMAEISEGSYDASPVDAYTDITSGLGNIYNLYDHFVPALDSLLSERVSNFIFWRNLAVLVVLLTVLVPLYFYLCFFVAISDVIRRLNQTTERMLNHEHTSNPIALDSQDEFADIARIFNKIANELTATNLSLANRVKEYELLAQEVRRKNIELERFNKFMIGREVRMSEIKKELVEREKKIQELEHR